MGSSGGIRPRRVEDETVDRNRPSPLETNALALGGCRHPIDCKRRADGPPVDDGLGTRTALGFARSVYFRRWRGVEASRALVVDRHCLRRVSGMTADTLGARTQ